MILELPPLPASVAAARCPNWTLEKAVHRVCPVCSSDSPHPVVRRPDKFIVHRCSKCRMIYLADAPCQEEIDKFYIEYGAFKGYRPPSKRMPARKRMIASKRNPFISILESTGGIKGLSVCEIGCSYGGFLELVQHKGGVVHGVELDAEAQEFLEMTSIPFTLQIDGKERYEIICLFQVLEHLISPREMVSALSNALHQDGRVLISIPNGGDYAKMGPLWVGFRVDLEHINYFDLHSLSDLLWQHGLLVEQYWEHTQPSIQRDLSRSDRRGNLISKARTRIGSVLDRIFWGASLATQGSFVLTALARKV